MGTWTLVQIVFDIFAALGFFVILMRMSRAPKDDPRLSRGLQLLQSKIAVIEDLSDRTEMQVNQLTAILDQKAKEVQAKVQLAEQHVNAIRVSTERSLEVAKIFQDKIPHQEIIERKNTIKYVQAARMAHSGQSVEEIAEKVDLPTGEIEFIAKVNRDRLMFSEDQLPEWAKEDATAFEQNQPVQAAPSPEETQESAARLRAEMELAERQRLVEDLSRLQFEMQNLDMQLARETPVRNMTGVFEAPKVETGSLNKLGEEFRKACEEAEKKDAAGNSFFTPIEQITNMIPQIFNGLEDFVEKQANALSQTQQPAPQSHPNHQAAAPAPVRDPEAARAKVQAALAYGDRTQAPAPSAQPAFDSDALTQARAMAQQQPVPTVQTQSTQAPKKPEPVIRKVQFPRIDMP